MSLVSQKISYLWRKLAHSPLFSLISIITLGLGIGASSAIFSVIHGVLLTPLPFDEPSELVGVWHEAPGLGFDLLNQSPALHFTYADENRVFDDIGMWDDSQVTITGGENPERVHALRVTEGTLSLLRVRPALGRIFSGEDDSPGAPETAILGYGYWQSRLGADPNVVGTTVTINGRPREVVGVMPADFRFPRAEPDLVLPFQFDRSELFIGNFSYQGIARLNKGATIEQANADIERMVPLAAEKFPFPSGLTMEMMKEAQFGANTHPFMRDVVGDVGATLWVLMGGVAIVLLIACANVANLFLVRAEGRQRELALRSALGADRSRIALDLLGESVMLGLLGGLAGLGVAYGALRILLAMAPETLPRIDAIGIDATVLAFTLAVSLLSGIFFGLFPVVKYTRPKLVEALKEGGRAASDGPQRQHTRNALVVAQIAMALVLLVASGLMIRSFQALRQVHPGFVGPSQVLTFRVSIPSAQIPDPEDVPRVHEQILRRIEEVPGITSIGLSSSITLDRYDSNDPVFVEEFPVDGDQLPPIRRFKWISPGYHETMGNPVVAGRAMNWDDVRNHAPVVMVTNNFATEYWHNAAEAVGKRVRVTPIGTWREIVGVVGDVHDDGVDQEVTAVMFWPLSTNDLWEELDADFAMRNVAYAVRSERVGEDSFLQQIRQAVWSMAPDSPLASVQTLDEILDNSMARTSFTLVMLVIAAVVALLIGSVGLYGVISYGVTQRTREIGVRMALGARTTDVSGLFLRQAMIFSAIGVLLGVAAAFGLTRLMGSILFNVSPADPLTYSGVSAVLIVIALIAAYIPARRASGVDPNRALHWE